MNARLASGQETRHLLGTLPDERGASLGLPGAIRHVLGKPARSARFTRQEVGNYTTPTDLAEFMSNFNRMGSMVPVAGVPAPRDHTCRSNDFA
jgi:hypothetical protein